MKNIYYIIIIKLIKELKKLCYNRFYLKIFEKYLKSKISKYLNLKYLNI